MRTKPELLVTAGSVEEAVSFIHSGATAVLVGENKYGMRLPGECSVADIAQIVEFAHQAGAKVYVSVNTLVTNDLLADIPSYLQSLEQAGVDAAQFGDPSVLRVAKESAPSLKLHWNAEMTSTNYATANYWGTKGASRVVLARELNMDEITDMIPLLAIEAEVQVHGITNIYHSKRQLVASYMAQQGRQVDGGNLGKDRALFLIEAERQDEKYPIYEDHNGTHIMSSDDICILEDFHMLLEAGVNSLKIESLLKPVPYAEAVIKAYRQAMDNFADNPEGYAFEESWLDEVRRLQDPERELSFGFFYKEQVY